jgi:2-methylisocitrate lyase-like PEP mutase family enzyme
MPMAAPRVTGCRRISIGGALARSAWGDFMRTARMLADQGSFASSADATAGRDLKGFFRNDRDRRGSE